MENNPNPQKKVLLFDLDGTLTNPEVGITSAVRYSLQSFDIDIESLGDLRAFIGPPLRESYHQLCHFDKEQVEKAITEYRVYYMKTGINENTIIPGIKNLLEKYHAQGTTLVVATSKPGVLANIILENFDIAKYFTFVAGAELDDSRSTKAEVIQYALDELKITDVSKCLMIGDRHQDIAGAKAHNMDSVGVLFGFGSRDELTNAGADYIVERVDELDDILYLLT